MTCDLYFLPASLLSIRGILCLGFFDGQSTIKYLNKLPLKDQQSADVFGTSTVRLAKQNQHINLTRLHKLENLT